MTPMDLICIKFWFTGTKKKVVRPGSGTDEDMGTFPHQILGFGKAVDTGGRTLSSFQNNLEFRVLLLSRNY